MELTVPAFVRENLLPTPDAKAPWVRYDNPKAADYARRHLEQVRQPIKGALALLAFHGEDVVEAVDELKEWLDDEINRLPQ